MLGKGPRLRFDGAREGPVKGDEVDDGDREGEPAVGFDVPVHAWRAQDDWLAA